MPADAGLAAAAILGKAQAVGYHREQVISTVFREGMLLQGLQVSLPWQPASISVGLEYSVLPHSAVSRAEMAAWRRIP